MSIKLKSQHVTNMYTPIELVTTNMAWCGHGGGGGVTDHGYLRGLGDNDHPQYLLASRSSIFMPIGNSVSYQLTAHNSLSLGTGATQSFLHTSLSSGWIAVTNSGAFALSGHTHAGLGGAASDHSHGNVVITNTAGTLIDIQSASNGLTVAVPDYLTTAYGAAIQGSGSYSQNTGTIQFVNGGGVTFGLSNDGVMTASVAAVGGAQTGISGIAGSGASTVTEGTIQFGNANGISFGLSSNTMTALYTVPGVTVFSNSNNVEFGLSGSTVTALANFVQTTQTQNLHNITLSGNTAGTLTQVSSGTLTLAGGSNITLSQSGNKISIIGAVGGHNVTMAGNTIGTLTEVASGTMTLAGGSNITLSQSGNAITIIGPAQGGVQTGISAIGASNTVFTSGTVIWSAQNTNIVVGSFITSDSQYVRLSVPNFLLTAAQSDHTHGSNISFGNTTNSTESIVRASSSSNGLTMVIPKFITTAALSQNATNYAGLSTGSQSTSNTDVKFTLNTAGLNLAIPKFLTAPGDHTHGSNVSLSLANLSGAASSASNGVTISMTGHPATSFVNVSDVGSLYFEGGSAYNMTWTSSVDGMSTTIMGTAGGGSGGGSGGVAMAFSGNTLGSTQIISNGTVRLVAGNNITMSQAGSIVTLYGPGQPAFTWYTSATAGSLVSIATGYDNTLYVPAYLTTATGLVRTGFSTTATAGSIVSGVLNSLGLLLAVPAYLTAGGAGGQITFSAGVSSAALTNVVFSNSNGLSFGLNGATITGAVQSGIASFVDGGGVTWGTSMGSNSLVTAITATIVGGGSFNLTGNTLGNTTVSGNPIRISGGNFITVSGTGSTLRIDGEPSMLLGVSTMGNTAGTTGYASRVMNFVGGSNVSLSQSRDTGGNSATVTINVSIPQASIFFSDNHGHSFSSSTSGASTTIYIYTTT